MAREIKFRAWHIEFGGYMSSEVMNDLFVGKEVAIDKSVSIKEKMTTDSIQYRRHYRKTNIFTNRDWVIEQFTGIKDSTGKEIYENDILEMQYGLARVYFENGCFKIEFDTDTDLLWLYCCKNDKTKIAGNVHQNPELLKEMPFVSV